MEFVVLYGKTLGVRDGDFDKLCCRNVEEEEEHVYATVHPPNLLQTTAASLSQLQGGGGGNNSLTDSPNRLAARTGVTIVELGNIYLPSLNNTFSQ